MKNTKENIRGITLIALIITLILLLILVCITIAQLKISGIIEKSKIVSEEAKKSQIQETFQLVVNDIVFQYLSDGQDIKNNILKEQLEKDKMLEGIVINNDLTGIYKGYEYYIDKNYNVHMNKKIKTVKELAKSGKIKAGDYINYTVGEGYETDENGNYTITKELSGFSENQTYNIKTYDKAWRVLSVNEVNGNVEIFSEDNIFINDNISTLSLKGKHGYNNYVQILNSISKHYINTNYAVTARAFGSNIYNPDETSQTYKNSEYSYIQQYANDLVDGDYNYIQDLEQIKKIMPEDDLKEKSKDGCILLASRRIDATSTDILCRINSYYIDSTVNGISYSTIYKVSSVGEAVERLLNWCMVVPVITLKAELELSTLNEEDDIEHSTEHTKWIIKDNY